ALAPYPPDPGVDEVGSHSAQARADPALHRALGLVERRGYVAVGQTAEVGELDRPPLVGWKAVEHLLDVLPDSQVEHLALDVVAALGCLARLTLLAPATRRLRPQHVHRPAVALGEEEGPERPPLGVEAVGLCPEAEEDLLHDLLGQGLFGEEAAGQGEDGSA